MKDIRSDVNYFYDKEVVGMIAEKYNMSPMDALAAYLDSETYAMFNDPELEMLDIPPAGIFDMWENERVTGTLGTRSTLEGTTMSKEMDFFIYLLEAYAASKGRPANEVMREWRRRDIVQFVYDNYWLYHTEAIENAYADIDSMLATGKPAW